MTELYKIRRISLIIFTLVLALPGSGWADSLTGVVLDPDGRAVPNTYLRLFNRNTGELHQAVSASDGTYTFAGISTGEYLLDADASSSALGASENVSVNGNGTYDVTLAISATSVDVLVTASGTPLSVQEIAKAVDVVDSEEIALRSEFSLSEAIRNLPGVRVQQLGGPGSFTTIKTRGLRNQDTAVLIDGMRFRDAASIRGDATGFLSDLTMVDTERIEFLRGAGSSLYGSNALAGTINVISREGSGRPHGQFVAEGGGLGMFRGVGSVSGGLDGDRLRYSGTLSYLNVSKGIRGNSPHRNTSAQGSLSYSFTPEISLTGRLWWSDARVQLSDGPLFNGDVLANFPSSGAVPAVALDVKQLDLADGGSPYSVGNATYVPGQSDPDDWRDSKFHNGAIIFEHQLTGDSSYHMAYQGVDTERMFSYGADGPGIVSFAESPFDTATNGRIDTLQLRTDHRIGGHNFVSIGYEFESERYHSSDLSSGQTGTSDLEQTSNALFAQDQIRLFDGQLQLGLSGRVQFFDVKTPSFSATRSPYEGASLGSPRNAYTGDAALAYLFRGTDTKFRAHVGSSYRAPSSFERLGSSFFQGSFSYFGDPRLSPERSIAVDGGLDQWLFNSKLRLSGTAFYTHLQETILFDFVNIPPNDPYGRSGGYYNSEGGTARGVELSGQVSPTQNTNVRMSYTYTNSDSNTPTIRGTNFIEILGVSDHTLTVTATQWIASRFNVTFDLFTVSDYSLSPFGAGSRRLVFDGPLKADLVLRYSLPHQLERTVEIYTKIENVFNKEHYEGGFPTPGAWAVAGLRFNY